MKSHHKVILALILSAVLGVLLSPFKTDWPFIEVICNYVFDPIGQIFLRLIFMLVLPMVFAGLVLGVFQLGSGKELGKVAKKTLFYTLLSSAASVLIGISLVNTLKPGEGIQQTLTQDLTVVEKIKTNAANAKPLTQSLVELIPKNPIDSMAKAFDGEMLAVMIFSLIFGLGLSELYKEKSNSEPKIILLLEDIYETCLGILNHVMKLTPYAVFSLVFLSTFKHGHQLLLSLLFYVGTVVLGLAIQQFVVYTLMLKYLSDTSPLWFFKQAREVLIYAFATASSNATLPKALEVAEKKLNLSPAVSRFVLTVGSTANQNGTALFEGITVLFLAQVYGIDLTLAQQAQVVVMSILAGVGTAGVPGGSLPLIMILLNQVGIPAEGIGLILGVDRFLDMCRTTINVSGDLVIANVVDQKSKPIKS